MAIAPFLVIFAHDARHELLAQIAFERIHQQPGAGIRVQAIAGYIIEFPRWRQDRIIELTSQSYEPIFVGMGDFDREVEQGNAGKSDGYEIRPVCLLQYLRRGISIEA